MPLGLKINLSVNFKPQQHDMVSACKVIGSPCDNLVAHNPNQRLLLNEKTLS